MDKRRDEGESPRVGPEGSEGVEEKKKGGEILMPRLEPPKCKGKYHEREVKCDECACSICWACHTLMPCWMHFGFFKDQFATTVKRRRKR